MVGGSEEDEEGEEGVEDEDDDEMDLQEMMEVQPDIILGETVRKHQVYYFSQWGFYKLVVVYNNTMKTGFYLQFLFLPSFYKPELTIEKLTTLCNLNITFCLN